MEYSKDLSIVVVSCDKYSDLWDDVFNLKDKFWPDCPYKTYLATDKAPYNREGVDVIHFGNIREWMVCTRKALESIDTPYVLFLMEDYFITKQIDNMSIEDVLCFMKEQNASFVNMHNKPYFLKNEDMCYKDQRFVKIPKHLRYGLDTAGAIWNRDFFIEQLNREDGNAWRFEAMLVEDAIGEPGLPGNLYYDTQESLNLCKIEVVRLGKFRLDAIEYIENTGYKIVSTRARMTKFEMLKDNVKGRLASVKHGRKFLKRVGKLFGFVFFTED